MRYKLADEARPQVVLLIAATILSVALWIISWYLPVVGYIVYPLQLFATSQVQSAVDDVQGFLVHTMH